MIKLGVNTVLYKGYSLDTAVGALSRMGYDGIEISAIQGMCEHLNPETWKDDAGYIREVMSKYGMKILSCEAATHDADRLRKIFEAASVLGIPVINIGPGGKTDDEETLIAMLDEISGLAEIAASYGTVLCCKAHVGAAIYNNPTTLRLAEKLAGNPYFGIDMDPSHIFRAGELPENAVAGVVKYMKHLHIRDCKAEYNEDSTRKLGGSPGSPFAQICGTGDINLKGYFNVLKNSGYSGPVCLEVIGPQLDLADANIVAAQSLGYMKACIGQ